MAAETIDMQPLFNLTKSHACCLLTWKSIMNFEKGGL
jgi:hypothetical protein